MNKKKEVKLVKKVKGLVRKLGCPQFLHHFGPKTYEFCEHLLALMVRYYCRLSYRRVAEILDLLGIRCPSKSALQYTAAKLDGTFWDSVLSVTCGNPYVVAIDGTGFTRTNPSQHYLNRIDGVKPRVNVKLSAAFDTRRKKFCAAKVRVLNAHDIRDAKPILKKIRPKIVVADKGYNAEHLYEFAHENGFLLMVPKKKGIKRGHYRKKQHKHFRTRTYHRRETIEAGFGSIKRKFGSSVSSKKARTIRSDVYGRLACHNIFGYAPRLLGQSLYHQKIYK